MFKRLPLVGPEPSGFKTFHPADEITEDFIRSDDGVTFGMDPKDNLPTIMSLTEPQMAAAPEFLPENLVCLETEDRLRCVHYKRQLVDAHDMGREHKLVVRVCTARVDEDGTFMSLRDAAVYACDLRSPRDPATERLIDVLDAGLVKAARERKAREEETFDLNAALKGSEQP